MKPAQTFNRHGFAVRQQLRGHGKPRLSGCAVSGRVYKFQFRPANRACVWLCVKTAVLRIGVLGGAVGTHGKFVHYRKRSVIRQLAHNSKSRSAVGAVGKRIAVAAVGGVRDVTAAVGTHGHVGRYRSRVFAVTAADGDFKLPLADQRGPFHPKGFNNRAGWRFGFEVRNKRHYGAFTPFGLDKYALRAVKHKPAHSVRHGGAVHKRTEAYSLHHSGYVYFSAYYLQCGFL